MPRPPRADGARVTIADVAARAGVSLSTVSRALNGNPTVDPALAEKVRDAAAALDYTASPVARSLVLGRTQTVAVVVPDLGNPTFQAILRGLSRAAAADDYHVLVADSGESVDEERLLAVETRRRTDGVVLCAPRMPQDELDRLVSGIRPVVLVNRESGPAVPSKAIGRSVLSRLVTRTMPSSSSSSARRVGDPCRILQHERIGRRTCALPPPVRRWKRLGMDPRLRRG